MATKRAQPTWSLPAHVNTDDKSVDLKTLSETSLKPYNTRHTMTSSLLSMLSPHRFLKKSSYPVIDSRDCELVRESWGWVIKAKNPDDLFPAKTFADSFYQYLFQYDPSIKTLFTGMMQQSGKLAKMLKLLVKEISAVAEGQESKAFRTRCKALFVIHKKLNITRDRYICGGKALLSALVFRLADCDCASKDGTQRVLSKCCSQVSITGCDICPSEYWAHGEGKTNMCLSNNHRIAWLLAYCNMADILLLGLGRTLKKRRRHVGALFKEISPELYDIRTRSDADHHVIAVGGV
eukprot:CFRG8098T1